MAIGLHDSVGKTVEEAWEEELHKKIEEEVRSKLTMEFNTQWAEKEAKIQNELAQERAVKQWEKKKVKSKMNKLWSFFKIQQAEFSTAHPDTILSQNDGDDDDEDDVDEDKTNLGDDSYE